MNMTFWKTFWASLLASIVSGLVVIFIFFLILNAFISGFDGMFEAEKLIVEKNTVLKMDLKGSIGDYTYADFDPQTIGIKKQFGVHEILRGLELAAEDDKVKGIMLNFEGVDAGMASIQEIRNGLLKFQESGKFVVAYSENYSKKGYYLASAAQELYVFPSGLLEFLGLGTEVMFVKGAMEKLDLEMQVIRGSNNKFKSAVEPLINDHMSDASKEQSMKYLDALWGEMVKAVSESRSISADRLNEIADSVYIRKSGDAEKYGMADGILYYDQVLDTIKVRAGVGEKEKLTLLSFEKYTSNKVRHERNLAKLEKKNIAVIFAEGDIVDGRGAIGQIGGTSLAEDIRKAREDDDIKAVVMRVNSPGGSALASDVVWREVILTKQEKPFIVSMGDLAASGGYYISCAADKIYAQPTTLTGSIGVFGIIPYTGAMFENKLGITFDRVQTNDHAILSLNKKLDESELKIVQEEVDDIYDDFISKVAKGRGMKKAMVDSIGQGRVWAGKDAIEIGLVDEFGGLQDAIDDAASRANIESDDIAIKYFPEPKSDDLLQLLQIIEDGESLGMVRSEMEVRLIEMMDYFRSLSTGHHIQARLPYLMWVE